MKKEEIREKIKEVIEIIKDIEEPYKVPSFEIVLSKLMNENKEIIIAEKISEKKMGRKQQMKIMD